jgi:hypothetical protein
MLEDRPREASEVLADYAEIIDSVGDYEIPEAPERRSHGRCDWLVARTDC